jgi:hypothetical protein
MEIIKDKVFVIDNFISKNTADFLINNFSSTTKETERHGVYTGVAKGDGDACNLSGEYKILDYDNEKDIAIDLLTSLCISMEKTMSKIHQKNMKIKSICYNHMKSGSKLALHYDTCTEEYKNDYAGLLFLTDTYDGGLLNFPNIDTSLKPLPGTFVSFFGNEEMIHEVKEITSGDRINLICFFTNQEV